MNDLNLDDLAFLKGPVGQAHLARLAHVEITPQEHLLLATTLREEVDSRHASALLETVLLRQRATKKFSRASEMFFTRPALEQASAEIISTYRAQRFFQAGVEEIADLGCGIGGDSIALATKTHVTGVDWDTVRLAIAQENIRVYERGDHFSPMQADLQFMKPFTCDAVFADPGRRDENGRRLYSLDEYRPPVSSLVAWRTKAQFMAIKISPGVDYNEIPSGSEVEFISVEGEVREAVLWYGGFWTGVHRRATLLPGAYTLTDDGLEDVRITEPDAFLYEPDGAIIRAHLVTHLAHKLDAAKIDPDIAYLTSRTATTTPFGRCFAIDDVMPFHLKKLRRYLRERHIGRVTIKKRGSPIDPDALRGWLHLRGEEECTIFLTQVMGKPTVLIGREAKLNG